MVSPSRKGRLRHGHGWAKSVDASLFQIILKGSYSPERTGSLAEFMLSCLYLRGVSYVPFIDSQR